MLVAGFLFGPILGACVGITGACMFKYIEKNTKKYSIIFSIIGLGATVCYWWALTLLKSWAEEKLDSKRIFKAIHIAVQDQSFKLIVICRLSPITPSAILNYLFATMGVNYGMYMLATVIGVSPLAIMYAYIGSLAEDLTDAFNGDGSLTQTIILLVFFVVSTFLLILLLAWIGKREIKKALKKLVELEEKDEDDLLLSDFSAGEELFKHNRNFGSDEETVI